MFFQSDGILDLFLKGLEATLVVVIIRADFEHLIFVELGDTGLLEALLRD